MSRSGEDGRMLKKNIYADKKYQSETALIFRSTKAFQKWLEKHPHLPMPPCLRTLNEPGDKKQPFVVPSDFVLRDRSSSSSSNYDLALPVSQFSLELKEVLSKLMNQ